MKRESAAWTAVGFAAALLMGAMAAPSSDVGRWQLRYDESRKQIADGETVLLDTADGRVWVLPKHIPLQPGDTKAAAEAWYRKAWLEITPGR